MKKVLAVAAVALFIFSMTSCKKEWTCECTVTSGGTSTTASATTEKMTKSDAKDQCEADNGTQTINGVEFTYECEIK